MGVVKGVVQGLCEGVGESVGRKGVVSRWDERVG